MDSTPFSKKCEIIAQAYDDFAGMVDWDEFFFEYDLGSLLAFSVTRGYAELTPKATPFIEDTWTAFCTMLGIDFFGNYVSLKEMLDFAYGE
jgi:hypothetical protein